MKISVNWLREYTHGDLSVADIVKTLVETGTEVDRIHRGPEGVVVARISALEPVPKSSKGVQFVDLDCGEPETVRVLTGAQNVKVGDIVPWAKPGARLPGFDAAIETKKVLGFESPGMLCAPDELGLGEGHDGIMILNEGTPGALLTEVLDFDTVLDVEVTPNRPDAMCHLGLARELSAGIGETVTVPPMRISDSLSSSVSVETKAAVTIDAEGCRRFTASVIEGVVVGPSPDWMQRRLRAIGLRPINNVVDTTNYVMWEMGQPLHCFDYDKFVAAGGTPSAQVHVRSASDGEKLQLLDGSTCDLARGDLVVCSGDVAVSLGAIMGGASTAVDTGTRNVLLECAAWDGTMVRATSKRIALRSDASTLFEKGLSDTLPMSAVQRAATLTAELAQGHILNGVVDQWAHPLPEIAPIEVDMARLESILGYTVELSAASDALAHLGFSVEQNNERLVVAPPRWRRDVSLVEDVAEEVGRILGYDHVPATLPGKRHRVKTLAAELRGEDQARDVVQGAGFDEAITWSFISTAAASAIAGLAGPKRRPIAVQNPLSEEWAVMRTSLLPGLCAAMKVNLNFGSDNLLLYEVGRVFWEGERTTLAAGSTPDGFDAALKPLPAEPLILALAAQTADATASAQALRHTQSTVAAVIEVLSGGRTKTKQTRLAGFHPGRCAEIYAEDKIVAVIGELDHDTAVHLDLRGRVVVAEVRLDLLVRAKPLRYRQPARFPAITQDLSVLVAEDVSAGDALAAIDETATNILEHAELYDEFRGVTAGSEGTPVKSWTFRLTFRAADRTLTGQEAQSAQEAIALALKVRCGAKVRA